jgi:hypothetical protein
MVTDRRPKPSGVWTRPQAHRDAHSPVASVAAMFEVTTFRLTDSAISDEMVEVDGRAQREFWYQQRGLVRRTTGCNATGQWCVISVWDSDSAADSAAAAAGASGIVAAWSSLVDPRSLTVDRYDTL